MPNSIASIVSRIPEDRRVHLRRLASGVLPTLPENEDEALYVLHELRIYIAYLHGGAAAACPFMTNDEATAIVEGAKEKTENVRVFVPRIAMWLGAIAIITQVWLGRDPDLALTPFSGQPIVARYDATA